jgi:phosphate uptake regulator
LDKFIDTTNNTVATFEKSIQALFTRNGEMAETVFYELKKIEKSHSDISKELFKIEDIQSAILMKTMLDSLERIASYSGDIAEVAINMSTEVS